MISKSVLAHILDRSVLFSHKTMRALPEIFVLNNGNYPTSRKAYLFIASE
jgi:hypothetical protein